MLKPSVSILVEKAYEKDTRSMAKYFSEREGVKVDIASKTPADANATINLIGKSHAKEYLPDLLIGFGSIGTQNSIYSPISKQTGIGASVSFSAKSKNDSSILETLPKRSLISRVFSIDVCEISFFTIR